MTSEIHITHHVATIAADEYVAQYRDAERVQALCAQCPKYGKVWGCPPHDFDVDGYLAGYAQATIYGSKIAFSDAIREQCDTREASEAAMREALNEAWAQLLPFLYEQEARHAGSVIFTGRCRLCGSCACARAQEQPCRHPDRLRYSLEAVGFDVAKTASQLLGIKLQWGKDGALPPYLTLVTALFTREYITPVLPDE